MCSKNTRDNYYTCICAVRIHMLTTRHMYMCGKSRSTLNNYYTCKCAVRMHVITLSHVNMLVGKSECDFNTLKNSATS